MVYCSPTFVIISSEKVKNNRKVLLTSYVHICSLKNNTNQHLFNRKSPHLAHKDHISFELQTNIAKSCFQDLNFHVIEL